MAVLWGDTGKVATGTLKKFDITLATPRENLLGTPEALPSTEPATAQVSITIQTSDLPSITPSPISTMYTAALYTSGKNTDAAAQTVSWRCLKNGASVATGTSSSITASQFWTLAHFQFYGVVAGDVLEIKLWSASANVNYDYWGLVIYPTRVNVSNAICRDVTFGATIANSLALGAPTIILSQVVLHYFSDSTTLNQSSTSNLTVGAVKWNATYSAFRVDFGDNQQITQTASHATGHPNYRRNLIPNSISFREVLR